MMAANEKELQEIHLTTLCFSGEPGRTRTCNLRIRSAVLYPIKLQVQYLFALKAVQI